MAALPANSRSMSRRNGRLQEAIMNSVDSYNLSTKRNVFGVVGNDAEDSERLSNKFMPSLGITFGEFCMNHVIRNKN